MTLWEFRCLANGFRKFNSSGEESTTAPPSEEAFEDALARYAAYD